MKRSNSILVLFAGIMTVLTLLSADCNFSSTGSGNATDHVITYLGYYGHVSESNKPVTGAIEYRYQLKGGTITVVSDRINVTSDPTGDYTVQKPFNLKKGDYEVQIVTEVWASNVFALKIDGESQLHIMWTYGSNNNPAVTRF